MASSAAPARVVTITTANKTSDANQGSRTSAAKSLVWDLPLRIFHWVLATCLVGSWITAEAGFDWTQVHFYLGYTSLGLIAFRVVWGFVGPTHARFTSFLAGPSATLDALKALPSRTTPEAVGHNPLGGWATVLILLVVATQATTGLFISDDIFWAGPYNPAVSGDTASFLAGVHHTNFNVLQGLVTLHLIAIGWYTWGKNHRIVMPMLSGQKELRDASAAIASSRLGLALCIAAAIAALVVLLVQLAPEPPVGDYF